MASKRAVSSLSSLKMPVCSQCRSISTSISRRMASTLDSTSSQSSAASSSSSIPSPTSSPLSTGSTTRSNARGPLTPRDKAGHPPNPFLQQAEVTLYSFPEYAPVSIKSYPSTHLLLPLRRDILHRAVIYEGDKTRAGTANTLTRYEVHGSNRKVRPQKGTGMARLGDKKNPMLRGGGVAFGPKPRSFATDLPRKMYDLAWRTALSYRFRRGELIVLDGAAEIERSGPGSDRWLTEMMGWNSWGKEDGGSLILTQTVRPNLWEAMGRADEDVEKQMKPHGRCLAVDEVDVKDLLELRRVIVERKALETMFSEHSSDLTSSVKILPHLR